MAGGNLAAAAICGTSPSRADVAPLQLDYDSDSLCPDRSTFAELVAQRVAAPRAEGVVAAPERIARTRGGRKVGGGLRVEKKHARDTREGLW